MDAGISQIEPQQVLPGEPGAHTVGGLAVGEILDELQAGDESQRRPAAHGKEVGKLFVGEADVQFIREPQLSIAPGERRAGDAGSVVGERRRGSGPSLRAACRLGYSATSIGSSSLSTNRHRRRRRDRTT